MSYQTSSKRSPPFWLLIGARKTQTFPRPHYLPLGLRGWLCPGCERLCMRGFPCWSNLQFIMNRAKSLRLTLEHLRRTRSLHARKKALVPTVVVASLNVGCLDRFRPLLFQEAQFVILPRFPYGEIFIHCTYTTHGVRCMCSMGRDVKLPLSALKGGLRSNLPLFDRHPKRSNKR